MINIEMDSMLLSFLLFGERCKATVFNPFFPYSLRTKLPAGGAGGFFSMGPGGGTVRPEKVYI